MLTNVIGAAYRKIKLKKKELDLRVQFNKNSEQSLIRSRVHLKNR